jgi:hypothetical protein
MLSALVNASKTTTWHEVEDRQWSGKSSSDTPVVTRAADNFSHEPGHRELFAPFCPLAFMLSAY